MTRENFGEIFGLLGLQLRLQDLDEITTRGYYEALKGLPVEAVQKSARAFAVEKNRRFFPTTAEWHTAAQELVVAERQKQLSTPRDEPWHFECGACEDTGWERFACPGDTTCGRKFVHFAHDYVERCTCRPNNRTYQRHHQVA